MCGKVRFPASRSGRVIPNMRRWSLRGSKIPRVLGMPGSGGVHWRKQNTQCGISSRERLLVMTSAELEGQSCPSFLESIRLRREPQMLDVEQLGLVFLCSASVLLRSTPFLVTWLFLSFGTGCLFHATVHGKYVCWNSSFNFTLIY